MSSLIASLDRALLEGVEWFTLRRLVGSGSSGVPIDVRCLGRIDAVSVEEIAAGIVQTDLNIVFSPTQINDAQWPGGSAPQLPPFDVDQRVPRVNMDKAIVRGRLRLVAFCDPKFINSELVRINMRVTG